jgi:serine/threonine-protein kinase HipA
VISTPARLLGSSEGLSAHAQRRLDRDCPDRIGRFVYGKSYLARGNAVAIDPIELKLGGGAYETVRLNGLFGAMRNAAPDSCGRRVIEKHSGRTKLEELDYLLESPDDRAGALGFGLGQNPPAPQRKFNKTLYLETLQRIAAELLDENSSKIHPDAAQIQELMLIGTAMGDCMRSSRKR